MNRKLLLGLDIGSSSVKAGLVDADTTLSLATASYPDVEAPIKALHPGWAEQSPDDWWNYCRHAIQRALKKADASAEEICAIGISWQMHGLVCIDKNQHVLRDSIIWCDSRAVEIGEQAFLELGEKYCFEHLLNSPGNFTASKLAWVKKNEPKIFDRISKIMLPGDYIAMRLTGEVTTTIEGLSEGVMWDFSKYSLATDLLNYYEIPESMIAPLVPTFGLQGKVSDKAAAELGIPQGTPITYRAGDQPNNAVSLNVFNPGEVAATAGTSGVVYGILDKINCDTQSRTNTFAHVNYSSDLCRLGVLLCINGVGSMNAWARHNIAPDLTYEEINNLAATAPIGSDSLVVLPFGNGAERMLGNRNVDCNISGISFYNHTRAHLLRAVQEGVAFSLCYGIEIMRQMGIRISNINAGNANMFLSPLFRTTLSNVSRTTINIMQTDGSIGAARAAGIGAGIYKDNNEAFSQLKRIMVIEPETEHQEQYQEAFMRWKDKLNTILTH